MDGGLGDRGDGKWRKMLVEVWVGMLYERKWVGICRGLFGRVRYVGWLVGGMVGEGICEGVRMEMY